MIYMWHNNRQWFSEAVVAIGCVQDLILFDNKISILSPRWKFLQIFLISSKGISKQCEFQTNVSGIWKLRAPTIDAGTWPLATDKESNNCFKSHLNLMLVQLNTSINALDSLHSITWDFVVITLYLWQKTAIGPQKIGVISSGLSNCVLADKLKWRRLHESMDLAC